jgi:hypothetical protein
MEKLREVDLPEGSSGQAERKLQAIRDAMQYSFPTADIDQMLREIEQGYVNPCPR